MNHTLEMKTYLHAGEITVTECVSGNKNFFWIQKPDGEGMSIEKSVLGKLLEDWYNENF
jgi:hypothetical protein